MSTPDRRIVLVHDIATGQIKQRVECLARDADKQHNGWPAGHASVDVTKTNPDAHPHTHAIHPKTGAVIARVFTFEEKRFRALHKLGHLRERLMTEALHGDHADINTRRTEVRKMCDALKVRVDAAKTIADLDKINLEG